MVEEEFIQDAISSVHKRPKIIAIQHIEIVQNGNDIELTEKNNSTDTNKSQANDSLYKEVEEEETENILEEQDKTQNEMQNQNIDVIPNVTESRMECEIATHINIKEKECEQPDEDIDKRDKKIEKSPKIIDEVQQKISQDEWEELDDILSVSLFDEKEKSKD